MNIAGTVAPSAVIVIILEVGTDTPMFLNHAMDSTGNTIKGQAPTIVTIVTCAAIPSASTAVITVSQWIYAIVATVQHRGIASNVIASTADAALVGGAFVSAGTTVFHVRIYVHATTITFMQFGSTYTRAVVADLVIAAGAVACTTVVFV